MVHWVFEFIEQYPKSVTFWHTNQHPQMKFRYLVNKSNGRVRNRGFLQPQYKRINLLIRSLEISIFLFEKAKNISIFRQKKAILITPYINPLLVQHDSRPTILASLYQTYSKLLGPVSTYSDAKNIRQLHFVQSNCVFQQGLALNFLSAFL